MSCKFCLVLALLFFWTPGLLPSAQAQVAVHLPVVQGAGQYPNTLESQAVTTDTEAIIEYQGFQLKLTNIVFFQDIQKFNVADKQPNGTIEILSRSEDRIITSFTAFDWDTVSDPEKWTVATFTNWDGSIWSLTTYMPHREHRTIRNGDQSTQEMIILDASGNPAEAYFENLQKIYVVPGIHRTGARLDSTGFGFGIDQKPRCQSVNLSRDAVSAEAGPVEITITADHTDEYRIISMTDQTVMVTHTGNTLTFIAYPNVEYQAQVRIHGSSWTNQGCEFTLTELTLFRRFLPFTSP